MTFGCGCGAGPTANLQGGDWGLALALLGWTYSKPLSRGLAEGGAAAQAGRMSRCAVHLHSLGLEHNLGLKSFNHYPSRPLTPQRGETYRVHTTYKDVS